MGANEDEVRKAHQHAQRKYVMEMERIVKASEEELGQRRSEMAASGMAASSSMWKTTADNWKARIEALLQARLKILLDAYELYGVPLDDEIEKRVLKEVSDLREIQIRNTNQAASEQPWLGTLNANTYISGQLATISDPLNAVKVEIEERRHKRDSVEVSRGKLIFVSCGQSTPAERSLGQAVAKLVEQETGCAAYFAQNQTTFEGVTENILKRLQDAVGFIAIMHPRGNVSNPANANELSWVRASVWVEQEVAIAAFIAQALEHPIKVRMYIHESIRREGLRDKLHLNPESFREDREIISDLTRILPSWAGLNQQERPKRDALSLAPVISHKRVSVPGGGDDRRYMLLVGIENDGELDATDFKLDVEFPENLIDEGVHMARIASGKPGVALFSNNSEQSRTKHLYPTARIEGFISFHYAIRADQRHDSGLFQQQVRAIVCSGNMKPKIATKSIAQLVD